MSLFLSHIPGWLHPNEVSSVQRICSLIPEGKNIIEIGSFAGRTTAVIAASCPLSDIYAMDPWWTSDDPAPLVGMPDYAGDPAVTINDVPRIFTQEITPYYPNVHFTRGQFPTDLPEGIDDVGMVYWDTDSLDYERLKRELLAAYHKVSVGGILAGHTFAGWMPSVVTGVRELAYGKGEDIILPPSGSIWYMRRTH